MWVHCGQTPAAPCLHSIGQNGINFNRSALTRTSSLGALELSDKTLSAGVMNVLMFNYEYPPLGGGAGNATAYLLKEFQTVPDLHVDLVTSSTHKYHTESLGERLHIHFLDIGKRGNLHFQTNRELLTYSCKALRYGKRLLDNGQYGLCHAFFGIPCGYVARKMGLPYIVSLRGSDVPFYNERFRLLDRLVFRRLSVGIWHDAKAVVANSKGLRELALQSSPSQLIDVIPNGVDTDFFRPAPRENDGLRVLCVSRLISRKNLDLLIRAMAVLRNQEISLTLIGTGNEGQRLRNLAREKQVENQVRFTGRLEHDQILASYQQSDVFVLPSSNEGMSNTVLEAMACGLPILMTRTGGAEELVSDGQNGFLLEKASVEDIVGKIRCYLQTPHLIRQHGSSSRKIAEALRWESVAGKYVDLYREVLGTREN